MNLRTGAPERGDVWLEQPARGLIGHEQQGRRPVLVVSAAGINAGPWPLVIVVPLSTRDRGIPLHVRIAPPDGGVQTSSVALVEQIHAADRERLVEHWGRISSATMREIDDRLRIVLDLD